MLLLTVVLLLVLLLISYKIFDNDLFAPSAIVCLSFLFSSLCALYNEKTWALDFSGETTFVLIVGVGTFLLGGIFSVFLFRRKGINRLSFNHLILPVQDINIEKWKILSVIIFQVCLITMIYREMSQNVGFIGMAWAEVMQMYRHESMHMVGQDYAMKLSFLTSQCISINDAFVFLFSYIVGNNLATKKKGLFLYWLPIVLGCVIIFMQGYRAGMLRYWIAILIVWYIIHMRSIGWKRSKETRKIFRKMLVSVVFIGLVFSSVRAFVGRSGSGNEWDPLYYVSFYGGCPVAALDIYLKNPDVGVSKIWGQRTFYYLNQSIGVWFGIPEMRYNLIRDDLAHGDFAISPNGTYVGNVYTTFRALIEDFGYAGIPVVMFTMGSFFTFFYFKIRNSHKTQIIDFSLLCYSYCAYTYFLYFFATYYFFLSTAFVKIVMFWFVMRWFLTSKFVFKIGQHSSAN